MNNENTSGSLTKGAATGAVAKSGPATKVLVFGRSGQVAQSIEKITSSNFSANSPQLKNCDFYFYSSKQADFLSTDKVIHILNIEMPKIVINTSAYTAVDKAESEKENCEIINAKTVEAIAKWCQENNSWLIHYSSDYVFDGSGHKARTEDELTGPLGWYGETKLRGDQAIIKSKCQHVIFRTSWVYSEFGHNFVKTMLKLGADREELKIVSDQFGAPTYANDIAEFTIKAVEQIMAGKMVSGVYNMVNTEVTNWHEFANAIFEKAKNKGTALKVQRVLPISSAEYPTPAKRPLNSRLSLKKLENQFGQAPRSWDKALDQCLSLLLGK